MEEFLKIEFCNAKPESNCTTESNNCELEIIKGLVVLKGSQVKSGLLKVDLPTQESSLKAFKLLFGVKKRSRTYCDDEESVHPPVSNNNNGICGGEEDEEEDFLEDEDFSDEEEENELELDDDE